MVVPRAEDRHERPLAERHQGCDSNYRRKDITISFGIDCSTIALLILGQNSKQNVSQVFSILALAEVADYTKFPSCPQEAPPHLSTWSVPLVPQPALDGSSICS